MLELKAADAEFGTAADCVPALRPAEAPRRSPVALQQCDLTITLLPQLTLSDCLICNTFGAVDQRLLTVRQLHQ